MDAVRKARIEKMISQALGTILTREVAFPEGSLVTVSYVALSDDGKHARVGVAVWPEHATERVGHIFIKSRGYLQHALNKALPMYKSPYLTFEIDEGAESSARIEKLLIDAEGAGLEG